MNFMSIDDDEDKSRHCRFIQQMFEDLSVAWEKAWSMFRKWNTDLSYNLYENSVLLEKAWEKSCKVHFLIQIEILIEFRDF